MICCGQGRILPDIARDAATSVTIERHRTLAPVLRKLKQEGYRLVGLEQADNSSCLYDYAFARKTVLVIGNERTGIEPDMLELLDDVVEIPVYGVPYAHNAATAAAIAIYEYCRQHREDG